MEKVKVNIGDKTYNCQVAKTEEEKRRGLLDFNNLPPDEENELVNDHKFYVYRHENKINGKSYIGITSKKNPNYRWRNGKGYEFQVFYKAILKYGWDNFNHIIEAKDLTEKEAKLLEINLIKKYKDGGKCYNIADGGDGNLGVPMPESTRKALLKANTGRKCSEETRRKISESSKGRHCSEKNKQLYRELYTGVKLSEEHKEKIRLHNKLSKTTILLNLETKEEKEFSSARLASLWLGLNESAVGKAIREGYLLKDRKYKAYRKNETSQS